MYVYIIDLGNETQAKQIYLCSYLFYTPYDKILEVLQTRSHQIVYASLELVMFLPQPPKEYWDCVCCHTCL